MSTNTIFDLILFVYWIPALIYIIYQVLKSNKFLENYVPPTENDEWPDKDEHLPKLILLIGFLPIFGIFNFFIFPPKSWKSEVQK